jgi:hypothetical protein
MLSLDTALLCSALVREMEAEEPGLYVQLHLKKLKGEREKMVPRTGCPSSGKRIIENLVSKILSCPQLTGSFSVLEFRIGLPGK